MKDKIKTTNFKFECLECRNEVTCDEKQEVDDVIECQSCGIEYELTERNGDDMTFEMIEEEK
jgi:transcription elongation factor Elf1